MGTPLASANALYGNLFSEFVVLLGKPGRFRYWGRSYLECFVFTSPRLERRDSVSVTQPDKNVRNAAANRQVDNSFMKTLLG